jgi:NAD(P)-dependent dehydrogenase (short-subunit alcohol dehydrogenase family)
MAEADFDDCLRANLISAFHTLGGFVGALRSARRPGAAVLVSSAAAQIGTPNHEAVAAAKAGVEGLVRAAAASHAGAGIRVNAVAPGIMETPARPASSAAPRPARRRPGNTRCRASARRRNSPA